MLTPFCLSERVLEKLDPMSLKIKVDSKRLAETKILVTGAGGIGCELLKCLVVSGFKKISVIDMDSIEKTNLNRQFLFNKSSIGKYKSEIVKERIRQLRNDDSLDISAYVGDLKDNRKFPISFYQNFDLIINALDNLDARMYMNNIACTLKIPLINGGTEGNLGFVGCYDLSKSTPCYSCTYKVKKETIPVCSIRLNPTKLEHCIGWALNIYEMLFCSKITQNYLEGTDLDLSNDELSTLKYLICTDLPSTKVREIDPQLEISRNTEVDISKIKEAINFRFDTNHSISNIIYIVLDSWKQLKVRINSKGKPEAFSKDDMQAVEFIYGMSNLRAINFGLSTESLFKIQELAGKIVPAIVSTNAVIAAEEVIEAAKIIFEKIMKNISLSGQREIASVTSIKDSIEPNCSTCQIDETRLLAKFSDTHTVETLINKLAEPLSLTEYDLYLGKNLVITDKEDEDYSDLPLKSTLSLLYESNTQINIKDISNPGKICNLKIFLEPNTAKQTLDYSVLSYQTKNVNLVTINQDVVNEVVNRDSINLISDDTSLLNRKRKRSLDVEINLI